MSSLVIEQIRQNLEEHLVPKDKKVVGQIIELLAQNKTTITDAKIILDLVKDIIEVNSVVADLKP